MRDVITLPDGSTLTWDEFCELSDADKSALLKPVRKQQVINEGILLPTKQELFPRLRAAAERHKLTEDDLLTYIKVMYDIFFPPEPVGGSAKPGDLPGKRVQKNYGGAFVQQSKPVMTPAGEFPSIAAATRYYQVDQGRIRAWIKAGKEGFYFIDKSDVEA